MIFPILACFGILLVATIYYDLFKRYGAVQAIISPLFNFSVIWWFAFPCHALLLINGWVDTQQAVSFHDTHLLNGVLLSAFLLLFTWFGERSWSRNENGDRFVFINYFKKLPALSNHYPRHYPAIIVLTLLFIGLALYFLATSAMDDHWALKAYTGNSQNIARIGNGPHFLLSVLFMLNIVAIIPIWVDLKTPRMAKIGISLVLICSFAVAVVMMLTLASRSLLFIPLFSLLTACLLKTHKPSILLALVIIFLPVLMAPAAQIVRYSIVALQQREEHEPLLHTPNASKAILPSYCLEKDNGVSMQYHATILDRSNQLIKRPEYAASMAQGLCLAKNYRPYFALQTIASTFGLADHTAAYLAKVSFLQFVTGVDHGASWSYNAGLSLLPRAIWPDKPLQYGTVAQQQWLYPEMFQSELAPMTLPPSFAIDFIFGFGIFVALFLSRWLGYIFSITHRVMWDAAHSDMAFAFSLYFMSSMFNIVRSGTGSITSFILFAAVVGIIYLLPSSLKLRKWVRLFKTSYSGAV